MKRSQKSLVFALTTAIALLSVTPASAGYYKTVYVETPTTPVVVREVVQQPVVVKETNYISSTPAYADDMGIGTIAAVGLTALVGGLIINDVVHHNKKHHSYRSPTPPHHGGGKPGHGGKPGNGGGHGGGKGPRK